MVTRKRKAWNILVNSLETPTEIAEKKRFIFNFLVGQIQKKAGVVHKNLTEIDEIQ